MKQMTHKVLGVLVLLVFFGGLRSSPIRAQTAYFFPPPRDLYSFRPDLYIFRVTAPHQGYCFRRDFGYRYMVMDGQHELRIECHGYRPFEALLDVVPNKTLHFDIELELSEPR